MREEAIVDDALLPRADDRLQRRTRNRGLHQNTRERTVSSRIVALLDLDGPLLVRARYGFEHVTLACQTSFDLRLRGQSLTIAS